MNAHSSTADRSTKGWSFDVLRGGWRKNPDFVLVFKSDGKWLPEIAGELHRLKREQRKRLGKSWSPESKIVPYEEWLTNRELSPSTTSDHMNAHTTPSTKLDVMPAASKNSTAMATDKRIERIKTFHQGTLNAFRDQMGYAFLAGVELQALKASAAHGAFAKLRAKELPELPERTAQQYMKFADALKSKSATVADLASQPRLLTDSKLAEEDAKTVCKAVHDAADGKSLTEMYRDLGVIRQPKKQGDVAHVKPKKLGLAEQHAQAVDLAKKDWKQIEKMLLGYAAHFTLLDDLTVNAQFSHLEAAVTARSAWLATPKKDRDEKKIKALFKPAKVQIDVSRATPRQFKKHLDKISPEI
jgi:hypothetical protein